MVFTSRKSQYTVVAVISRGEIKDCFIAKREGSTDGSQYTLILIKEHSAVKLFLDMYRRARIKGESPLIDSFSVEDDYVLVYPYRQERPLKDFYVGDALSVTECESVCINVIMSCISANLPYPMLYLMIKQRRINISKDGSVFFGYDVDLSELDLSKGEKHCATECAALLVVLLEPKAAEKSVSYELLLRRTQYQNYDHFAELYRDLSIAAAPTEKGSLWLRIKSFFSRNADTIFGILFWICLILVIIAVCMLISNTFIGDIPWLRIFFNSFKEIGTESLLQ
jgi:hypothetical protein